MSQSPPPAAGLVTSEASRRALAMTAVGLVAFVAAMVGAYFAMPAADIGVATVWRGLLLAAAGLGLIVMVFVMGLRRVRTSERPLMRTISLVVTLVVTFVLGFAYFYLSLEVRSPGQLPGLETHLDALYFTVTMLTTVGFGDIAPIGQGARALATTQMVFNLAVLGALVRIAVTVGRAEHQRRVQAGQASTEGG